MRHGQLLMQGGLCPSHTRSNQPDSRSHSYSPVESLVCTQALHRVPLVTTFGPQAEFRITAGPLRGYASRPLQAPMGVVVVPFPSGSTISLFVFRNLAPFLLRAGLSLICC